LDELNLAPSDVLEALNRVLDDNRELFIPETQQVVKAHERFMLFATQNPAGLYAGRKVNSVSYLFYIYIKIHNSIHLKNIKNSQFYSFKKYQKFTILFI